MNEIITISCTCGQPNELVESPEGLRYNKARHGNGELCGGKCFNCRAQLKGLPETAESTAETEAAKKAAEKEVAKDAAAKSKTKKGKGKKAGKDKQQEQAELAAGTESDVGGEANGGQI